MTGSGSGPGPIGRLFPLTILARRNLTRARARTALATLGIVVGVVAISSLGIFGVAFYQAQVGTFQEAFSSVSVTPGEDADVERFDDARLARVSAAAPEGMPVVGVKTREGNITVDDEARSVEVKAIERPREEFVAAEGAIPRTWRDGVVVGDELAAEENISAGDVVRLDGEPRRVRAILTDDEGQIFRPGEAVFVPFDSLARGYDAAIVRAGSFAAAPRAATRLDRRLNVREGTERYRVQDFGDTIDRIRRQKAQIDVFLLGVGAISMFVAGVSILNVMLMSVMERREEIGVLRAVGYHRLDVLRLVLGEAALLGVVGATIGAAVSLGVGALINAQLLGDPLAFSPEALSNVAVGVGFGLATAVVSGLYPAWKAANARPVEALRD